MSRGVKRVSDDSGGDGRKRLRVDSQGFVAWRGWRRPPSTNRFTKPLLDMLDAAAKMTGLLEELWMVVTDYYPIPGPMLICYRPSTSTNSQRLPSVVQRRIRAYGREENPDEPVVAPMVKLHPSEAKSDNAISDAAVSFRLMLIDPCGGPLATVWNLGVAHYRHVIGFAMAPDASHCAIATRYARCTELSVLPLDGQSSQPYFPEVDIPTISIASRRYPNLTVDCDATLGTGNGQHVHPVFWFFGHDPKRCKTCERPDRGDWLPEECRHMLIRYRTIEARDELRIWTPGDTGTVPVFHPFHKPSTLVVQHPQQNHMLLAAEQQADDVLIHCWCLHTNRSCWSVSLAGHTQTTNTSNTSNHSQATGTNQSSTYQGTVTTTNNGMGKYKGMAPRWAATTPAVGTYYASGGGWLWLMLDLPNGGVPSLHLYTVDDGTALGHLLVTVKVLVPACFSDATTPVEIHSVWALHDGRLCFSASSDACNAMFVASFIDESISVSELQSTVAHHIGLVSERKTEIGVMQSSLSDLRPLQPLDRVNSIGDLRQSLTLDFGHSNGRAHTSNKLVYSQTQLRNTWHFIATLDPHNLIVPQTILHTLPADSTAQLHIAATF